ncbi:MAG: HlyD family efflux transporter periplasmic adaptor subunit [Deltaproteobacteria bacterium]|nr:HlyD family efflux transporter periplasmic adaptor subunit [Deltaproteobacteria bacterium]
MTLSRTDTYQTTQGSGNPSISNEMAALLMQDASPDVFLSEMLKTQCQRAGADGGVIFRLGGKSGVEIMAAYPPPRTKNGCPRWIVSAVKYARDAIECKHTIIRAELRAHASGGRPQRQVIVIPVQKEHTVPAVAAFVVRSDNSDDLVSCRERLEITPFLISFYEIRWSLKENRKALDRLHRVLEVFSIVNSCKRFMSAAMALCNESATCWHCYRVSLGFLNRRYVRIQAMSHTDKFNRKMKLLQDIEAAMEECLDQDIEVIHPAEDSANYVNRAAEQLSKAHGPGALFSLPIRRDDEVPAVLTMERSLEQPFMPDEIETIRLLCDLCAPRLVEMYEHHRWFGVRLAGSLRKWLGQLLGPRNTWLKLWVLLIFCTGNFLIFGKGEYRVQSPFVFEPMVRQVVVSPIDTFIKSVSVAPGDEVKAGKTILGILETSELRLKLAALRAEQLGYQKEMAASIRDRKTVEYQIAQAKNDRVAAEIRLLEQNIGQAKLVAPITGWIISEDLRRQIGAPIEKGKILFEIASIESLRAELYVPEEFIADVKKGQKGELASVGHPEQRIGFIVERINPMADVVNHRNVFKVRARLLEQRQWMRPGMEGIAKITAGRKRYIWIASRRLVNWLRMKLWF